MNHQRIITIDGPAGSGKSAVSAKLGRRLGYIYLYSGLLYRAIGLIASRLEVSYDDDVALANLARDLTFKFWIEDRADSLDRGVTKFSISGSGVPEVSSPEELVTVLTSREAGVVASKIAVHPELREVLTKVQRESASNPGIQGVVLEGRDAGSVVFPDAKFKFYLDASLDERTKRRVGVVLSRLPEVPSSDEVDKLTQAMRKELAERDERDMSRAVAPLSKLSEMIVIDSSKLSEDEVVERLFQTVKN